MSGRQPRSFVALPAPIRAKVALWRERAADGVDVTCGGRSMEPALRMGDRVAVRAGPPRAGAVIAFVNRRGDLELHRLVARGPLGWWVHAGDNQSTRALGVVHASQIVGVAALPVVRASARVTARAAARVLLAAMRVVKGRRPRSP